MQRILLCTDGSRFASNLYQCGGWFARRLQAEVDVLCVTDERRQVAAATRNYSGSIGLGASETLLEQLVELDREKAKLEHKRSQLILEEAREALAKQGVDLVHLYRERGIFVDCFQAFEPQADLVVLGKRGTTAEAESQHLGGNLERIVRASHKPCLVVSSTIKPIARILLAHDGSESCWNMLQFLLKSPAFQGLELHIATVSKRADDEGALSLIQDAETQAKAAGFTPMGRLLVGHPEEEIALYVKALDIDLLMMGAYGHSRIRRWVIGSTTAQLLRSSPIPVLVYR